MFCLKMVNIVALIMCVSVISDVYLGLGKIGFTTGDEEAPAGSVRKGWTLEHPDDTADQTFLNFEGKTLTACGGKAPFSVWVDEGANDKGCRGFSSYVIESEPISCTYTTA